jgi:hypothetical protein
MSAANGPDLIQNGLVLCLDAADKQSYSGSGTTWRDLSGNSNNGSLLNSASFSNENGGAIVLTNANSNVNCNGFTFNQPNLTFSCWFKTNSIGDGYKHFISKELSCKVRINNSNGQIELLMSTNGIVWTNSIATDNLILANIWYNVSATVQSNGLAFIYLNGISRASGSLSGTLITNSNEINIGSYNSGGPDTFNGRIAVAKVYNRALSVFEIIQNYNATKGRFNLT